MLGGPGSSHETPGVLEKVLGGNVWGQRGCVGEKYPCWGNPEMSLSDSQIRALSEPAWGAAADVREVRQAMSTNTH